MHVFYVYIMSNRSKTLYVGVTNNIRRRFGEHKGKLFPGFTEKYNINKLVYLVDPSKEKYNAGLRVTCGNSGSFGSKA